MKLIERPRFRIANPKVKPLLLGGSIISDSFLLLVVIVENSNIPLIMNPQSKIIELLIP